MQLSVRPSHRHDTRPCHCGTITRVYGEVFEGENRKSVYAAELHGATHHGQVVLGIGFMDQDADATPVQRVAIVQVWATPNEDQFHAVGPEHFPDVEAMFRAAALDREGLLASPWRDYVFHVAEHAIQDPAIRRHLDQHQPPSS